MVIASHVIITAYGFWLPNDPRGSWSDFVGAWELARFGKATRTSERRSLACEPHDRALRLAAKKALKHPPVKFTGRQALEIAHACELVARGNGYRFLALSILPTHIHAVLERHGRAAEGIVGHLKFAATQRLLQLEMHPFQNERDTEGKLPTMWTKRAWKVFLDSDDDVARAVKYVQDNPEKEGKPAQRWRFVV